MKLSTRFDATTDRRVAGSQECANAPPTERQKAALTHLADGEFQVKPRQHSAEELQSLYREDKEQQRRDIARRGLWLAVFMYLLYSATDIILIRDVAIYTIGARFLVGILFLAIVELQYRFGGSAEEIDITCAVALVTGYIAWLFPAMTSGKVLNLSYYMVFGSIFMMGINLFFNFSFNLALIASATVLCAFLISLGFFEGGIEYRISFALFYSSCFVFTSYVNRKLNRERYSVFLNAIKAKDLNQEAMERGQALLRLSNTDALTGLENRRSIDKTLRAFWKGWQTDHRSFAAILVDVDHFKRFNDLYGHQEGDRCLTQVADALTRATDTFGGKIGRYGGEEFIVVTFAETREQVTRFADNIRKAVEDLAHGQQLLRDDTSSVTVSVGAALTQPQTGQKLERLIHEADRALYAAKASGRNCARFYDINDPQCRDDSEDLAALLKVAVARNLVSIVYQPIYEVTSGVSDVVEALMRLKSEDGHAISPSDFIPIAEQTGAIFELGRWLIRTVCLELLAEQRAEVVTVNISPVQLKAEGFAASVAAILRDTGVEGRRLAFEITEGLDIKADARVLACIEELRAMGIAIWLDDFGTGFAGLSWLRLIDFDTVKIDRSFLYDANTVRGKAMLQDMVGLLRKRGYSILVEGVETEEQMLLMRELWIDQVQGFHLGRPIPAQKVGQNKEHLKIGIA